MTTMSDTFLNTRTLCLRPTVWWQRLLDSPKQPIEEVRHLSFRAKADWPDHQNWFNDPSLDDVLFDVSILSKTTASRRLEEEQAKEPESNDTIGGLRYNDWVPPFVTVLFWVSDAIYDDIWERVKYRILPKTVCLQVLGLRSEKGDYWDIENQPKLKVLGVEVSFYTEESSILLPNLVNQTMPDIGAGNLS